jgi:signal transduction histidine kinase
MRRQDTQPGRFAVSALRRRDVILPVGPGRLADHRGAGAYHRRMDSAEALSDAVLAIAAEHAVEPVLRKLVNAARELAGARYAAIGVPDGDGGFAQFIPSGMSDELIASLGELPRTHGLLGAILESEIPHRTTDIRRDPRFRGWWPDAHPSMSSFLGVPIVARGAVAGAFYLTDKEGADAFSDDDQALIETFAAHAALAIENARLHERSRELSIVEERNRLARELHDAVTQKLFGVVLAAESGSALLERDVDGAATQLRLVRELAGEAMEELRSVIVHLRPPALEAEGLAVALGKHVDVLRRAHRRAIELDVAGGCPTAARVETDVFRIAQEALHNALRHARAARIAVRLRCEPERLELTVADDGVGFDVAAVRSRRLGLTTMAERARAIDGDLAIDSAPGAGTTVRLLVRP